MTIVTGAWSKKLWILTPNWPVMNCTLQPDSSSCLIRCTRLEYLGPMPWHLCMRRRHPRLLPR